MNDSKRLVKLLQISLLSVVPTDLNLLLSGIIFSNVFDLVMTSEKCIHASINSYVLKKKKNYTMSPLDN